MIKDVNLLSYLPPFMQNFREIKSVFEAEDVEFKSAWQELEKAFLNSSLITADESGIARREQMLGIQPKADETLDERRFTILSRINARTPFTEKMLLSQLENLCGAGNYSVEIDCDEYMVNVLVGLVAKNSFNDVADLLERFVPANMVINLGLKYNRHNMFTAKTNNELKQYTHLQMRNEVMTNG